MANPVAGADTPALQGAGRAGDVIPRLGVGQATVAGLVRYCVMLQVEPSGLSLMVT